MKNIIFVLALALVSVSGFAGNLKLNEIQTYDGKMISLKNSKAFLFVNIATRCGYTGQLDGLQKLYASLKSKGLMVVGIPSNEFGGQSPENNEGIGKFCRKKYGVEFPIMKRASVLSKNSKEDPKSEIVSNLLKQSGEGEIRWNFEKFLVGKDGKLVKRFRSGTGPGDSMLKAEIKKLL